MGTVGLSLDHPEFDEQLLKVATAAILKTRDGKQWFAKPKPMGTCTFVNDATEEEMASVLKKHKEIVKTEFSQLEDGIGTEAFVDASDLGQDPEELLKQSASLKSAKGINAAGVAGGVKDAEQQDGLLVEARE